MLSQALVFVTETISALQSQVSGQCVEIWRPAGATWTIQDRDENARLGGMDKEISAGYGIEEPMLGPRASASIFGEFSKIFRSKIKNVHPYSFSSYVSFCTELHSVVNMQ